VAAEVVGAFSKIDARLSERSFGDLELEPDHRYEQVWAEDRLDATHRSWGVESVVDVVTRAAPVAHEATLNEHFGSVILCTHGDIASALVCASLGVPLEQHREVGALDTGALRELTGWPG